MSNQDTSKPRNAILSSNSSSGHMEYKPKDRLESESGSDKDITNSDHDNFLSQIKERGRYRINGKGEDGAGSSP